MAVLLLLAVLLAVPDGDPEPRALAAAPAGDVRVDGLLDEAAWADAEVATDFVQFEPAEGAPSSERTEVRVLRGPDALYVGARMWAGDPAAIRRTLSRRDDTGGADAFYVALDSYNDDRTAYVFGVTAAGVQIDALQEGGRSDESWDAVWSSEVSVGADGWTAEIRVPYSQLRFSGTSGTWGANFQRVMPARGEEAFWAPITRAQSGSEYVRLFGDLHGVGGISPRPVLQVLPYTLAGAARQEDPARRGTGVTDFDGNVGADLKLGLSSNVTLDATVNPDFGQVESDPAQLNLSTFETVLSERRPFFVEGTQIFDLTIGGGGDGALLYTRRIGAASPIIAAAKLTGRTARGLSFGTLASVTGDAFAPSRLYGAARLKQEFGGQSYVGGGLTGYARAEDADAGIAGVQALAGAGDWALRFAGGDWLFEGSAAGALRQSGDDRALGGATYIGLDKVQGYVTPGFGLRAYTADFQLNDVGRFRQTDLLQARGGLSALFNGGQPVGPFRRLRSGGFVTQTWALSDRANRGLSVFSFTGGELHGFQEVDVRLEAGGLGGVDVRETRGLGPVANVPSAGGRVSFETDSRRQIQGEVSVGGRLAQDGGSSLSTGLGVDWTASDRLSLQAEVGLGWGLGERAWAANEALFLRSDGLFIAAQSDAPEAVTPDDLVPVGAGAAAALDGVAPYEGDLLVPDATAYYVPLFAARDTRRAELSTRGQVIFGPGLSLQLFGQLFAARGRYRDVRLLADVDDFRTFDAYPKRRDFAVASFIANAVLRWEYRPGSTLFVVWSQGRDEAAFEESILGPGLDPSPWATTTGRQLADALEAFPRSVVLVKLNYLLMR